MEGGIPPREFHACSEGMLVKGKRHQCPAPTKTGKSIAWLAHWIRIALAGEGVMILDRENGSDEYARRMEAIASSWNLSTVQLTSLRNNLVYFEYPRLKDGDANALLELVSDCATELVVFDSQRMFLTDLGLRENEADDYAKFMAAMIDPLHDCEVTTFILDNTGYVDSGRSRGSVTKADLNEVILVMSVDEPFDAAKRGRLRLTIGDTRFGNRGTWTMSVGAGHFGYWTAVDESEPVKGSKAESLIIEILNDEPFVHTKTRVRQTVGGNRDAFDEAWGRLIEEGSIQERNKKWALKFSGE